MSKVDKELMKQLADKAERKVFTKAEIAKLSEITSKINKGGKDHE